MRAAVVVAAVLLGFAVPAVAQTSGPLDWRRSDLGAHVPAAIGLSGETAAIRHATIVARAREERPLAGSLTETFRGMVFRTEIKCDERLWRILSASYYSADYALVRQDGDVPWAPLVRETPLHAAVTDVCDEGHAGPAELTTDDVVAVQRWLDGS